MAYFLLFIFGLAIGSFLNVLTLRFRPDRPPQNEASLARKGGGIFNEKSIGGRSHCLDCSKTLSWYELIPVFSFLVQKGKCRNCGHKISLQYPIVEIITGLVFVFVPFSLLPSSFNLWSFSQLLIAAIWLLIFTIFIVVSIIDLRHSIIPNQTNLTLGILGLILIVINNHYNKFDFLNGSFLGPYAMIFGLRENIWLNHLFAALLGMIIFGAIIILSRGKAMGWGDFKLIAALGLVFGWPDILMVMLLAFIVGALISVIFLIRKKKKMKDMIPFGPFLIIGATFTFFFGYQIMEGYFRLFGL